MDPQASDTKPSWSTIYRTPPPIKYPYDPKEALGDLPGVSYALELFLASHMVESEDYCHKSDEKKERLYFATGYGLIQCVKGLMSYADEDLLSAINHTRNGNYIAGLHRKKAGILGSLGLVGSSTHFIKSMTDVERHAELVYAESLFEKALLGIVYSGDWLAFIKEALNMRTTIGIYRHLGAFLDDIDAAYAASLSTASSTYASSTSISSTTDATTDDTPTDTSSSTSSLSTPPTTPSSPGPKTATNQTTSQALSQTPLTPQTPHTPKVTPETPTQATATPKTPIQKPKRVEDPSVDADFRSGVYLGVGMCNIILSLMPGKLATLVELFGYKGDRTLGLELLMRAGLWDRDQEEPGIGTAQEGVRRSICDMVLLIFHLVLSSFTVEGVDIQVARRILDWNLKRYPNGVFFLFGAGRLALHTAQPRKAIGYYARAMAAQGQYRNLDHISFWEIAIARLALWEVGDEVPGEEKSGILSIGGSAKQTKEDVQIEEEVKGESEDDDGEWEKVEGEKIGGSAACWRVLEKEATWSKAIYSYGLAACLLEDWDTDGDTEEGKKKKEGRVKEAIELMARVPEVRQKIAGKSIPLEKYVARKARKYASQQNRLLLPALEVAYLFQAIAHAPKTVVARKMLPLVQKALAKLALYGQGTGVTEEAPAGVRLSIDLDAVDELESDVVPDTGRSWLAPPSTPFTSKLTPPPSPNGARTPATSMKPPPSPFSLKPPSSPLFSPLSGKSPRSARSFMSGITPWGKDKGERAEKKENARKESEAKKKTEKLGEEKYEGGKGEYWDDLCLARFLEGVCLRFVAYPDPDAIFDKDEVVEISQAEAAKGAELAFRAVFEYGPQIELDHHLVYHAHYELGRLLACQGNLTGAKAEFELVISGKYLEVGPSGRKGRYSMENALHIRTHAALDALQNSQLQV